MSEAFVHASAEESVYAWVMKLLQAGFRDNRLQSFVRASYKTDGAANEDYIEIKFAVLYAGDFVLVHTTSMNETKSGNKCAVTVTPLIFVILSADLYLRLTYRGADKPLARPGRKQATATEDFDFHISYL